MHYPLQKYIEAGLSSGDMSVGMSNNHVGVEGPYEQVFDTVGNTVPSQPHGEERARSTLPHISLEIPHKASCAKRCLKHRTSTQGGSLAQ